MADYNATIIPGTITTWQRCHAINIQYPYGADNSSINVRFEEEVVKILPGGEVLKSAPANGGITKEYDPDLVIQIRNPATWELTGQTVTMGEILALLGSAYWQFALERDGGE
jgi:hypothetical protein